MDHLPVELRRVVMQEVLVMDAAALAVATAALEDQAVGMQAEALLPVRRPSLTLTVEAEV